MFNFNKMNTNKDNKDQEKKDVKSVEDKHKDVKVSEGIKADLTGKMDVIEKDSKKDEDSKTPKESKKDEKSELDITVTEGGDGLLYITKGEDILFIYNTTLMFRRDYSNKDTKYRLTGENGSILVTEEELDYIYNEFKNYNKD